MIPADLFDKDPLGCEPGTTVAFTRPAYRCPFCGASERCLSFIGIATDYYAVRKDYTLIRLFSPSDETELVCGCWPGFWMGGLEPFFIEPTQIQELFEGTDLDLSIVQ